MKRILSVIIICLCLAPAAFGQSRVVVLTDNDQLWGTTFYLDPTTGTYIFINNKGVVERAGIAALTRADCLVTFREEFVPPDVKLFTFTVDVCNDTGRVRLTKTPEPGVSVNTQLTDTIPRVGEPEPPQPPIPPAPSNLICIVDHLGRGSLSFDSATGAYTLCTGGATYTGTGSVFEQDGILYLKDEARSKQRVYIDVHLGLRTGHVTGSVAKRSILLFDKSIDEGGCGGCQ